MRSAHDTTSPSGVDGAGRLHEWLRIPSSVSIAEVQWRQRDVGAPDGVVVAAGDVRRQGVLAGVATRAVAAVVAEGDRLGEGDVEAERAGHGRGDLGDLEGVGEAGALVVVGEHEHLRLAGQPAERRRVEDAVAVAFEARPPLVGLLRPGPVPGPDRTRGAVAQQLVLDVLAGGAPERTGRRWRANRHGRGRRPAACAPSIVDAQRSARSCIDASISLMVASIRKGCHGEPVRSDE